MTREELLAELTKIGVPEAALDDVADNIESGKRTLEQAKDKFGTKPDEKPTGVLAGGKTIQVRSGDGTTRFYQVYEFPPGSGSWVSYQFSSAAQAVAALGNNFNRATYTEERYNQLALAEGQAEEIVGLSGSFGGFAEQIMNDAARAAGNRDPGLVGRMASNPEMKRIMAQAIAGDWTPEQILAEQRRTNFWKTVLYPGIDKFYGKTTEPEKAWNNYVGNVTPALVELGYVRDADGTFNSSIKRMLDSGLDDQTFLQNAPIFAQATQNRAFFDVLRARTQRELGKDLTFRDWFGLLKGESAPEIAKVAEGAVLAYQAKQSDTAVSEGMLQRLIAERDLSEAEARNLFSEVNQAVLALGETGLRRGALTRDDVLSAAAGINPSSGLSTDEVRLKVAKLARENALFDDEKINFYVGFSPQGTPTRPGLNVLAPEGA